MIRAAILASVLLASGALPAEVVCPEGSFDYQGRCATYPVLKEGAEPAYPKKAKKAGITGVVEIWVTVTTEGKIENAKVVSENPTGWGFGEAAVKATRRRRYEPAIIDGRARAVSFSLKTTFSLPVKIP